MFKLLFIVGILAGLVFWAPTQGGTLGVVGDASHAAAYRAADALSPFTARARDAVMQFVREQAHRAVEQGLK
jgi:hypothetical protein